MTKLIKRKEYDAEQRGLYQPYNDANTRDM
jgi:hypothetical protein